MASSGNALAACVSELTAWRSEPSTTAALSPRGVSFLQEPSTLRRYAAATNGDAAAAKARLLATVAWRDESLVPPLSCPDCSADPLSHCFHCIGFSEPTEAEPRGCALVYACAARARTNETVGAVRHMLHTLEQAWAAPAANGAERLLWIVDFNGFGMSHAMQGAWRRAECPPPPPSLSRTHMHTRTGKTSNAFLSQFQAHLPERLGLALLINPPWVFDLLLAVMRPFIDARTMAKVKILRPAEGALAEELKPYGVTNKEQLQWLADVLKMEAVPGSLPAFPPLAPCLPEGGRLPHAQALFQPS
jgi:hypothetical protein